MPRIYNVAQGSEEWFRLRLGIPTASCFSDILTPKTLKLSEQSKNYAYLLLAEWALGRPVVEFGGNANTERGQELEPEACKAYEFERDCDVMTVGFVTTDDGKAGASPDRLVGYDGLLELKCPLAHTHLGYMVSRALDEKYALQLQGQLWVTGRKWVDVMSYFPGLPSVILRVEPIEKYQAALQEHISVFVDALEEAKIALLKRYGYFRRKPEQFEDPLGVSDQDVDAILESRKEAR
jgi:hypothetical protein